MAYRKTPIEFNLHLGNIKYDYDNAGFTFTFIGNCHVNEAPDFANDGDFIKDLVNDNAYVYVKMHGMIAGSWRKIS